MKRLSKENLLEKQEVKMKILLDNFDLKRGTSHSKVL